MTVTLDTPARLDVEGMVDHDRTSRAVVLRAMTGSAPASTSWPGRWLILCIAMLTASAFGDLRPEIGGLWVHPVTLAVSVLFVFGVGFLRRFPRRIFIAMGLFVFCFAVATLVRPIGISTGYSYVVKVAASAITVFVAAVYLRRQEDFHWAVCVFLCAAVAMALRGYATQERAILGINPLHGIANKNAFSLFALPALLLGAHLVTTPTARRSLRVFSIVASLVIIFALFSTANRSGWLGVITVLGLTSLRAARSLRSLALLVVLTASATYLVFNWGNMMVIKDRLHKTDARAGDLRMELVRRAVDVGLENPLLGASPQALRDRSGRLTGIRIASYDSHNVLAMLFGGTGILGLLSAAMVAWSMWRRPYVRRPDDPGLREAHFLLRAMLVLWLVRGQFTAEILYSPSFSLGLGLAIGLCILHGGWRRSESASVARSRA